MRPPVEYRPEFLTSDEADELLEHMMLEPWRQETVRVYGREHKVPRLQLWYGDQQYAYSGSTLQPRPFPPFLRDIVVRLGGPWPGCEVNSCLANLYRDGSDKVAWHADDEPELGPDPVISCISLGATRTFQVKPKNGGPRTDYELTHGSMVTMTHGCQLGWVHQIPARKRVTEPRASLTFRTLS